MRGTDIVASRNQGLQLPLSLGTSVPIERLLTDTNVTTKFKFIVINVRTLLRNLINSIPSTQVDYVDIRVLALTLGEEVSCIKSELEKIGMSVVFYCSRYRFMERILPGVNLKVPQTQVQKINTVRDDEVIKLLLKHPSVKVVMFEPCVINFTRKERTLMLSHHAVDLMSSSNFIDLTLIESFTGALKDKSEWHTKLTNGKKLDRIPFTGLTLTVFGDNGIQITPQPYKIKKAVLDTAEKNNWTTITKPNAIKNDLMKITDIEVRNTLKRMSQL